MEFIELKKGAYLSVEQMNAIYNNFQYLKEKLQNAGFSVGYLIDCSVDYNIAPVDILPQFNAVEINIQMLHTVLYDIFGDTEKN